MYYELTPVKGQETVLILRQSANIWHAFGTACWTASHSDVKYVCNGGLGDAITTDLEFQSYKRYVRSAPEDWAEQFAGLNAAKEHVYA